LVQAASRIMGVFLLGSKIPLTRIFCIPGSQANYYEAVFVTIRRSSPCAEQTSMNRKTIFVIALSYLSVILLLGLLFFVKRDWLFFVPDAFGPVAVGVPWFGALGAVLISLTGVFEHEHDWDESYWPWHLARPLIGITLGVVSVLILQAGVLSVSAPPQQQQPAPQQQAPGLPSTQPAGSPSARPAGSPSAQPTGSPSAQPAGSPSTQPVGSPSPRPAGSPSPQPAASPSPQPAGSPSVQPADATKSQPGGSKTPANSLLYYLIAFLVGYREETFRELIKRLVDVILSPGNGGGTAPAITGVNPANAPHDTSTHVTITGSGFTGTQGVRFGNAPALFTVSSDGQLAVTTPVVTAGTFPMSVPLTVTTKGGSATVQFTLN
jgi:hypothetical protein